MYNIAVMLLRNGESSPCGVPEEVFAPGFRSIVDSPSGLPLSCQVTDRLIRIEDMTHMHAPGGACFVFDARVDSRNEADNPQLSFLVRTYHENAHPTRHPDLRAAALLARSIAYFDEINPLVSLKARWDGEARTLSTNYDQFRRAIELSTAPPEEAEKAAAFCTWTGRQAMRHGFTILSYIERKSYAKYNVVFKRQPED